MSSRVLLHRLQVRKVTTNILIYALSQLVCTLSTSRSGTEVPLKREGSDVVLQPGQPRCLLPIEILVQAIRAAKHQPALTLEKG